MVTTIKTQELVPLIGIIAFAVLLPVAIVFLVGFPIWISIAIFGSIYYIFFDKRKK